MMRSSAAAGRVARLAEQLAPAPAASGAPSVLIVGASRGIGLGLVQAYAASGWEVHATTRTLDSPGELGSVAGDVTLHACDVTALGAGATLAADLAGVPIDVLIYNAGVNPDDGDEDGNQSFVMNTNAIAPFLIVTPLLENVGASKLKTLALVSSQLGSREEFGEDGAIPKPIYHASKCVLNDGFREQEKRKHTARRHYVEQEPLWREAYGLTSVIFHPGWVVTDMGGEGADITVDESVEGMKSTLEGVTASDSGKFYRWNGTEHPW